MKCIFLVIILLQTIGSQAQKKIILKGTVAGYETGEIYLLNMGTPSDTLAQGQIIEGHFKLTGHTSFPQVGYIRIKNVINGPLFFLENTHFTAHLKITEAYTKSQEGKIIAIKELGNELNSDIQGGKDQQIANQYWQLLSQVTKQYDTLQVIYQKAEIQNDQATLKQLEEKGQKLGQKILEKAKGLIHEYKDSYVSAYVIQEYLTDLYEEETEVAELYRLLDDQARNSVYGRKIFSNQSSALTPQVGDIIPDFTLTDLDNNSQSLYGLKGKIKILDFWAGWCVPCLNEMPELFKFYNQYKSQGVQVITITLDKDKNLAKKLRKKLNLTWPSLGKFQSTDTDVQGLFNMKTIPYRIILDQNNHIVRKGSMTLYKIRETIDSLLK